MALFAIKSTELSQPFDCGKFQLKEIEKNTFLDVLKYNEIVYSSECARVKLDKKFTCAKVKSQP
jgi:hypothetical protein